MAEQTAAKKPKKRPVQRPSVFSPKFTSAVNRIGKELEPLTEDERSSIARMLHDQFCTDGE